MLKAMIRNPGAVLASRSGVLSAPDLGRPRPLESQDPASPIRYPTRPAPGSYFLLAPTGKKTMNPASVLAFKK